MTPDHVCPYGLKTLDLLERQGFDVGDRHLRSDDEATEQPQLLDVETTPQTSIDGDLVGTLDDVRKYQNLAMIGMGTWMLARAAV